MQILRKLNWSAENYQRLNLFLDRNEPGLAVFDLDNTLYCGDIGDLFFYYQFITGFWRPEEQNFKELIIQPADNVSPMLIGNLQVNIEQLCELCTRFTTDPLKYRYDYLLIFDHLKQRLEEVSAALAYSWMLSFFKGLQQSEVDLFVEELLRGLMARRFTPLTVFSSFFKRQVVFNDGIFPYPEMLDLISCLKEREFKIAVVSASEELLVKKTLQALRVDADYIIGMRAALEDGCYNGRLSDLQACNYGPGKVYNIKQLIAAQPVFVSGDSNGDFEMLTSFPETQIRLIIKRNLSGKIASLYQLAEKGENGFLLQPVKIGTGFCFQE